MTQPGDTMLWYSRTSVPTPLGIAAQLGWLDAAFAAGPVALRSLQASDDPELRAAHVHQRAPNCLRQGGSVPALWARAAGADTRLIGLTQRHPICAAAGSGCRNARRRRSIWRGPPRCAVISP